MSNGTVLPVAVNVAADRVTLAIGGYVIEVMAKGAGLLVAAYDAADIVTHDPDRDWPASVASFELLAPPANIEPDGRVG